MKTLILSIAVALTFTSLSCASHKTSDQPDYAEVTDDSKPAAHEYLYSKLQMKNYDEMQNEVKARVQKAEKTADADPDNAKNRLRDALQLIFSRPNSDNMVSQLVPIVRTPLRNLDAFEDEVGAIIDHCIENLNDRKVDVAVRATNLLALQNILGELKPDINNNPKIKELFVKVRDAKIEIADSVKKELLMRSSIKAGQSPSDTAKKVLSGGR